MVIFFYYYCVHCGKNEHEAKILKIPWEKIKDKYEKMKGNGKSLELSQFVIAHCNVNVNE
jgi:hypothetical protein